MSIELIEPITFKGIIKIFEWPADWTVDDIIYWTLPKTYPDGTIWRPVRMSKKELERYQVREYHNALTTAGRNALLSFAGSSGATTIGFALYLAIGSGPINQLGAGDLTLANEIYRQVPNSTAITGTQNDLATIVGTNTAPGTWAEYGLFGKNATATANSGQLNTHALANPTYTKVNGTPATIDYLINLT